MVVTYEGALVGKEGCFKRVIPWASAGETDAATCFPSHQLSVNQYMGLSTLTLEFCGMEGTHREIGRNWEMVGTVL
jgi:hypothetical protein